LDSEKAVWIWVDAICINQADNAEEAHQVAAMGDVYSCADRVLVWLGEAADDPVWKAVLLLYSRAWFQRLCIVQEAVLARECVFLYGRRRVAWDVMADFAHAIEESVFLASIAGVHVGEMERELVARGSTGVGLMTKAWRMREGIGNPNPEREDAAVMSTMAVMQSQSAAVKVDYVYAVRGMLPDALRRRVVVDYSDEVKQNYGMVHAKFFRQCLEMVRDWPSNFFPAKPTVSGIPSWCPPWGTGWNMGYLPQVGCTAGRPAATSYLPSFNQLGLGFMAGKGEEGILRVAGVAVDTIRDMFRLDQAFNEKTLLLEVKSAFKFIRHCEAYTPAGADGAERLLGVLIGECGWANSEYFSARPEGPLMDSLVAFLETRARVGGNPDTVEHAFGQFRFWWAYFNRVHHRWRGRALALTTNGRIALVPLAGLFTYRLLVPKPQVAKLFPRCELARGSRYRGVLPRLPV
jgi:hypothetical protein